MASKKSIILGLIFFLVMSLISATLLSFYEGIPFWNALYSTLLLLTTVDILHIPNTLIGRVISVVTVYIGMGAVLYTATAFASFIIEGRTNMIIRGLKGGIIRMKKEKNHIIVCGYGMIGRYTLESLKKETKKYIIIDKDPQVVEQLLDKGESVIQGDALDPHILKRANIEHAKILVTCLGENSDNIYLVMTATDLNPQITIAAKASDEDAVSRLHKVGAQIVVMPEVVGGKQLANAILEMKKSEELSAISNKK